MEETHSSARENLSAVYYEWIAVLLATHAKTGLAPNSWLCRPSSKLGNAPGDARRLSIELWLHVMSRTPESLGWVESVHRFGSRSLLRILKRIDDEPTGERVLGHCRNIMRQVKPYLTPDRVRAAIESGWTGKEMRGVTPMREVHHLLRLVREWLPEESRPPEAPVPREHW
jgi:hypothetical protein